MGLACARTDYSSTADVPLMKTPAWQGGKPEYGEQILLRRETREAGALLLKHSKRETVYRYERDARSLTPVLDQAWESANGPVAECGKQFAPPSQKLDIDRHSNKLMTGTREISTAGPTVLKLTASPGGQRVAVLSAAGPIIPSLLPFAGGSAASGEHYHQVISLSDPISMGEAVRLPLQQESDLLIACWSADEQMVVYYNILFTYLAVVETALPSTSHPQ